MVIFLVVVIIIFENYAVACGEFCGQLLCEDRDVDASLEEIDVLDKAEERLKSCRETLEQGPTIVYVPTRKETLSVSKFLCQSGVKAAAYNASVCLLYTVPNLCSYLSSLSHTKL